MLTIKQERQYKQLSLENIRASRKSGTYGTNNLFNFIQSKVRFCAGVNYIAFGRANFQRCFLHLTCCKTPFQTNKGAFKSCCNRKISIEAQHDSMLHINNINHSAVIQKRRGRGTIALVEDTNRILKSHPICQDITILDRAKLNDVQGTCSVIEYNF